MVIYKTYRKMIHVQTLQLWNPPFDLRLLPFPFRVFAAEIGAKFLEANRKERSRESGPRRTSQTLEFGVIFLLADSR
jgi:hypothetical protein